MLKRTAFRVSTLAILAVSAVAARAEQIYGVFNASNVPTLAFFDSASPLGVTTVGSLSGLLANHTFQGIDFRPATGGLYAVSSSGTTGQLYTVNLATGALTTVGGGFALPDSGLLSIGFNPTVDRLRVVSTNTGNLRVNPVTGGLAATDTALSVNSGDAPFVTGVAYTNNRVGATTTTLYAYDQRNEDIDTIGSLGGSPTSPNTGQMLKVGEPGVSITDPNVGFDISGPTGIGYISALGGTGASLYTVNLATGALTSAGTLGVGFLDISVSPVPEPATMAALGLGALALVRRRRRASK